MKRAYPYFIGSVVLLFFVMVLVASRTKPLRRMDERITLRQRDKIPYGTSVAKQLLSSLFPAADIQTDARYPGSWDAVRTDQPNQAVVLIADYFDADSDELDHLRDFVRQGNDVFLIARSFSDATAGFFHLTFSSYYDFFSSGREDSLRMKLEQPFFEQDSFFVYPGKRYEGSIRKYDTARAEVLGRNENGWANFVRLRQGDGRFYVHTAPLAFSNYFILHKQNIGYYQQVLSVLPKGVKTVLWNEYFLQKPQNPRQEDVNWLGALLKQPAFRWGFFTALATLFLYMLLGMRRRQRVIPPYEKPRNDSLDFVRTLGRLYYDKRDHKNLAEKMAAYFLEHVRSTYKIATHPLDEELVKTLHWKSGYPEPEIKKIVNEIERLPGAADLSEEELAHFHKSLELFYQNT